ncbi:hypothetical protein F4779DRAFT_638746 [Xylariaceae sp. FL0662B]|nr:hypothetical protein F4779DRAFT_638746 [Xylariaceae sp. FL0662B]
MDNNSKFALAGPLATSRTPLSNRSNINLARSSSPRWEHKDSSEGQPSSHSSIYDAAWVSTSDVAKSPYQTTARPATPPPHSIDLNAESPLSRLETPFLYGHGTELTPILEQRSIATLRTGGSLSTSDISSLLQHNNSHGTTSTAPLQHHPRLRRQHSFSLDDRSPSPAGRSRRRERSEPIFSYRPDAEMVDIHAYPKKPSYPAHQGSTTPPGYAEWWERTISGANGDNNNPQPFRGLRSGHGNLSAHPYMRRQGPTGGGASRPVQRPRPRPSNVEARAGGTLLHPWGHPGVPGRSQVHGQRRVRATSGDDSVRSSGLDWPPHDDDYGAPAWTCKACHRPADQWWSLQATIVGRGEGSRRGDDWCTRCAWRKLVYLWCCCEYVGL